MAYYCSSVAARKWRTQYSTPESGRSRLVGSLTDSEIRAFCDEHGICDYIITSARDDTNISALLEKIRTIIPWDRLAATTTTLTFKRMKEHVLYLKEVAGAGAGMLLPVDVLREQLEAQDPSWSFSDNELMTAVEHLANHGYVTHFGRADGKAVILLAPDLLLNLASSVVLEARRHERGLGLIDEVRLLAGEYRLAELADLSKDIQGTLLDEAVGLFLQRNLCFRETLNGRACLIFPSLINERRPSSSGINLVEDFSYRIVGEIETVYAAHVVLLGYSNLFAKEHHWQNQAEYELDDDQLCGFRRTSEREGEVELVLYHSQNTGADARALFRGAFETFLKRRKVRVGRLPALTCPEGHLQHRAAVREAIDMKRPSFFCHACGSRLITPLVDDVGILLEAHATSVYAAQETAQNRTQYEVALAWVKAHRRDRGDAEARPTCFIGFLAVRGG